MPPFADVTVIAAALRVSSGISVQEIPISSHLQRLPRHNLLRELILFIVWPVIFSIHRFCHSISIITFDFAQNTRSSESRAECWPVVFRWYRPAWYDGNRQLNEIPLFPADFCVAYDKVRVATMLFIRNFQYLTFTLF